MLDLSKVIPVKAEPYPFTELQEKCIRDLETTDAPQGRYALESSKGFCCLGRFCVVAGAERVRTGIYLSGNLCGEERIDFQFSDGLGSNGYLPVPLVPVLSLRDTRGSFERIVRIPGKGSYGSMTNMNDADDNERLTFKEIAQYIRHDPWNVFLAPDEVA